MDYEEMISALEGYFEGKDLKHGDALRIADGIETLLAERDALYKLAKRCPMQNAKECSHYDECFKDAYDNMCIMRCASCVSWQRRGPQKHD